MRRALCTDDGVRFLQKILHAALFGDIGGQRADATIVLSTSCCSGHWRQVAAHDLPGEILPALASWLRGSSHAASTQYQPSVSSSCIHHQPNMVFTWPRVRFHRDIKMEAHARRPCSSLGREATTSGHRHLEWPACKPCSYSTSHCLA